MKLDATIVVPTIVIVATLIVGWLMAWLDIRQLRKENTKLENDFWQEHDFTEQLVERVAELKERNYWLEKLTTEEDLSDLKKPRKEAPAGDSQSPQSRSAYWQVQSYYALHPTRVGKNQSGADSGTS